jgi:hypothetical protein
MHVAVKLIVLLAAFVVNVPARRVTFNDVAPVVMFSIAVPVSFIVDEPAVPNFVFSGDDEPQIFPAVATHVPSAIVPPKAAGAAVCVVRIS